MKPLWAIALVIAFLWSAGVASAQERVLTLDDIYDPQNQINFSGSVPRIRWLSDGKHYLQPNTNPKHGEIGLLKVAADSGNKAKFLDATRMEAALNEAGIKGDAAKQFILFGNFLLDATDTKALIQFNNDLYFYDLTTQQAKRLTTTPEEESDESFSPDGKKVGFIRGNDIYILDLASSKETRLTNDGSKNIFNGKLDWVYEEEIYGRGVTRSYWWNNDGSEVAYLRLDDTNVPEFTVTDDIPEYQRLELTKYPRAGAPNPTVKLGVVATSGGETQWVDLATYQPIEFLITRVGWTPDNKNVIYQVQNREQNWLDLNVAESKTGKAHTLLREESKAWVEVVELPEWLPDGSFIWQSDRSGWRHLYHYSGDGKLIGQITKGNWDIREVYGSADGWIYFSASEQSPITINGYRVKVDGSNFTNITKPGYHTLNFNKQLTQFVDLASNVTTPIHAQLVKNDGSQIRVIEENKVAVLSEFKLGTPEFVRVPTRDGFMMDAMMIKPPNFDPNKKYPVMSYTYSGPSIPSVKNAWGGATYMWHQMLAQRGYIIWICDNRSASQKGIQSAHPVYKNLGELELEDLIDGVNWLKSQSYVDGSRIGLWGWSYGGYMTAYALTHSKEFKIGISGAPVTDWRNYDSVYTERYMGVPQKNAEGYRRSSVVDAAAQLHGKLLLIHGTMDDNVHIQNSIQFIDALQRAGKPFSLMVYPKSRHGVTQPARVKHLRTMMTQFILENL